MRKFFIAAAVAVVSLIASGSSAQAAFSIQVYDDGSTAGVTVLTAPSPLDPAHSLLFSATTPNFTVSGGTATIQASGNGTLQVSYNDTVTLTGGGTHTLTLLVTNTDYGLPTSNLVLLTSSGGGSFIPTSNSSTIVGTTLGFLDSGNAPFGGVTVNGDGTVSTTAQSTPASTTGTVSGPASSTISLVYTPGTGASLVPSAAPFSLTNASVFVFSGQAGDQANISNSLATAAAPAPAGLVLALAGMPVLGLGAWVRRRRAALAA